MLRTMQDLVASRVSDLEYEQRKLKNLRYNYKSAKNAIEFMNRVLSRFKPEDFKDVSNWVETSGYSTEATLTVSITMNVTSLTSGPIAHLLRFLMEAGIDAAKTEDTAGTMYAFRTFSMMKPATDTMIAINITVHAQIVEGEDATCHKVQVGVQTKEVPVFEIKCD